MRWKVEASGRRKASGVVRGARLVTLGLVCAWACGGQSDRNYDAPAPSSGGAAGSGGTDAAGGMSTGGAGSPSGGSAGTGGSAVGGAPRAGAPTAGTASAGAPAGAGGSATGGSAGSSEAGAGGMAGEGPASFPECTVAEDCEIVKDCCACRAAPKGTAFGTCRLDCGDSNACEMQGIAPVAACTLGRCTLAASCAERKVTCDTLPPACDAGQAPSVSEDGCWGPCVASTECPEVTDCSVCGDAHCVEFPNVGGTSVRCIARETGCEAGNLCECLSPCGGFGCSEQESGEVGCYCLGC